MRLIIVKVVFITSEAVSSGRAVVPVFEKKIFFGAAQAYLEEFALSRKKLLQVACAHASPDGQTSLCSPQSSSSRSLTFWTAGKKKEFDAEKFGAKVAAAFCCSGEGSLTLHMDSLSLSPEEVASVAVGARLASYRFFKHRTQVPASKKISLKTLRIVCDAAPKARACYSKFYGPICDGQLHARDLVNEPANVLFPKAYATRIKALRKLGLEVEVLGEKEMKALKMKALLGVGKAPLGSRSWW